MGYLHAIKASMMLAIFYIIVVFYIPGHGPAADVELLLTIATFLFAILVGFYMSRLGGRYNTIREIIADEDAAWLSLYKTAGFHGKAFSKKIAELIDKYYIVAYDYPIGDEYKHNAKYFLAIYDELIKAKINNVKKRASIQIIAGLLERIEQLRNRGSIMRTEVMSKGQWLSLLILAAVIMYCIYYLHTPNLASQIITVLLATTLSLVLLIMRDLQNLKLSGQMLAYESGEEIFEFIGKLRYYNANEVEGGFVKISENIKSYRLGHHKPGEKMNISIVKKK